MTKLDHGLRPEKAQVEARTAPVSLPSFATELLLVTAVMFWSVAILLRNDPGGLSFDPDSYMHLARFREGYGIFHGGFVPRDNAPYGTVLPWTMPFDGALALLYAIGRTFTDPSRALYFAARIVSPFFCVTLGPIIFFGLRPFFPVRERVVMAGLGATAPGLIAFSVPGEADHHALVMWASVLFALALSHYLFLDRRRSWRAAAAGIAAAGALWTSLEGFIIIGAGLSALMLHRCLVERARAERIWVSDLVLGGAFAFAVTGAWLVDPPYEGLSALKTDRLSIVYVAFAWLFSVALVGVDVYLLRARRFSRLSNLVVAGLLGGAAFLSWIAIEPDVVRGPFGQVDRSLSEVFFADHDPEMLPIWRLTDWTVPHAACLVLTWLSLGLCIARAGRPHRWYWIAGAFLMVPISLIGIRYIRAIYFAEVFGSVPLGLVLADFTRRFPKHIGYAAVAASVGVSLGAAGGVRLLLLQLTPSHENVLVAESALCDSKSLSDAIAPIRDTDAIVMVDINFAPQVLFLSPRLRTIAGPFHRNAEGVRDALAFFGAQDGAAARAILDKRGVEYVLVCDRKRDENRDFVFADRILHNPPGWLAQVGPGSSRSGFRLYRVRPRDE